MQAEQIKTLIEAGIQNSKAIVEGDDGVHFNAVVISLDFAGKNRVQKQQMVYATLGDRITDGTIHALSIKTFTPDEWQNNKNEFSNG